MGRWMFEVIADASGKWVSNRNTYATKEAAELEAQALMSRWTLVTDWRAVPVESSEALEAVVEGLALDMGLRT